MAGWGGIRVAGFSIGLVIKDFDTIGLSVCPYAQIQYIQWHIDEFHSRLCPHHIICRTHTLILISAIVYF